MYGSRVAQQLQILMHRMYRGTLGVTYHGANNVAVDIPVQFTVDIPVQVAVGITLNIADDRADREPDRVRIHSRET